MPRGAVSLPIHRRGVDLAGLDGIGADGGALPNPPAGGRGDERRALRLQLTVWTSGAVTIHARGIPSAADALLFLAGAVAGFALVGVIAHGRPPRVLKASPDTRVRLWGGFHLISVGAPIGATALVTAIIQDPIAWPLVASSRRASTCS